MTIIGAGHATDVTAMRVDCSQVTIFRTIALNKNLLPGLLCDIGAEGVTGSFAC